MQNILKMFVVFLFTMSMASISSAANPSYDMTKSAHFTSTVNLYNQTSDGYTVNATYMGQYGATRKFVMALNAYPYSGSSISFPVVLPEYAVFLQVIRNLDGYVVYTGYISSDDVYIRSGKDGVPSVTAQHR
jgi:hypothetical protein